MRRAGQRPAPGPHVAGAYREGLREPEQQAATAACSGLGLPPSAGAPACDAMTRAGSVKEQRREMQVAQAYACLQRHATVCLV